MATFKDEHEAQAAWEAAHPEEVAASKARATVVISADDTRRMLANPIDLDEEPDATLDLHQ